MTDFAVQSSSFDAAFLDEVVLQAAAMSKLQDLITVSVWDNRVGELG